jgi:hypothetical protein
MRLARLQQRLEALRHPDPLLFFPFKVTRVCFILTQLSAALNSMKNVSCTSLDGAMCDSCRLYG